MNGRANDSVRCASFPYSLNPLWIDDLRSIKSKLFIILSFLFPFLFLVQSSEEVKHACWHRLHVIITYSGLKWFCFSTKRGSVRLSRVHPSPPLQSRTAKNTDWSTGPLARPFHRSLTPLTRLLAPPCLLRSCSLARSLTMLTPKAPGTVYDSMTNYSVFFSNLDHSASWLFAGFSSFSSRQILIKNTWKQIVIPSEINKVADRRNVSSCLSTFWHVYCSAHSVWGIKGKMEKIDVW